MVGCWKFDENAGSTAFDSSGQGNDGTLFNGPAWTTGHAGAALQFDGADDYVSAPDAPVINFATSNFTLAAWIYLNSAPSATGAIVSKMNLSCAPGYFFGVQDNQHLVIELDSPTSCLAGQSTLTVPTGGWHHVAAVFERSGVATFYVDGNPGGTVSISASSGSIDNTKPFSVGSSPQSSLGLTNKFAGKIDEVKVWNRALTPSEIAAENGVTAIAAGLYHTCALKDGGVWCWGKNANGELGNGTTTSSSVPVAVSGLTSGVAAISAGQDHTCALTTSGGLKCWGRNDIGMVGDGTTTNRNTPVDVSGLTSGVAAVSAGGIHTCAVTTGGGLKCWGSNDYGDLGNGTYTDSKVPVGVTGLTSGVAAIAAGGIHTCALTTGGGVKCWGYGVHGELGDGSDGQSNVPVDVTGMASGIAAITGGSYHTCAVTTGGGAKCWGYGFYGQVGNSANGSVYTPVDVTGLTSGVAAISGGWWHTCARTTGGGLKCWGRNDSGQLGNGTNTDSNVPVDVSGLTSGVEAVSVGGLHSCGLTTSSDVKCWGNNTYGQLGNGTNTDSNVPVAVVFQPPITPTPTNTPTATPTSDVVSVGGIAEAPDPATLPSSTAPSSGGGRRAYGLAGVVGVLGAVIVAGYLWHRRAYLIGRH